MPAPRPGTYAAADAAHDSYQHDQHRIGRFVVSDGCRLNGVRGHVLERVEGRIRLAKKAPQRGAHEVCLGDVRSAWRVGRYVSRIPELHHQLTPGVRIRTEHLGTVGIDPVVCHRADPKRTGRSR